MAGLDLEWNIPSMLSSTQLAMVGWRSDAACTEDHGQFLHLVLKRALGCKSISRRGSGVVFLFLGLDEFFAWKESLSNSDWLKSYTALGAAIVLATMIS